MKEVFDLGSPFFQWIISCQAEYTHVFQWKSERHQSFIQLQGKVKPHMVTAILLFKQK